MKLVIDMNLSTDWVPALRAGGVEAVHWATIGPLDAADEVIMGWARANDAIVLTRDLDFAAAALMHPRALPSVIQLRIEQARPERHLPLVQRALSLYGLQLEQGAVVSVQEERLRVRLLDPDADF